MTKKTVPLTYLDDFLLFLQTNNYSDKTVYNYERDLLVLETFLTELGIRFEEVTKKTIDQYKAYLFSRDRATATESKKIEKLSSLSVNRMLSSLRAYLRYLISIDSPTPLPPEVVRLARTERKHPQVAELKDLIRLIEAPSRLEKNTTVAARNRAMLELLFATGMRISELLSLKRNQLDSTGRIFIRGKGKKERFVYLTDRSIRYLQVYLRYRNDDLTYLFIPYRGRNTMPGKRLVARISTNYLQSKIKSYREVLKINLPVSAHSFRHGFATYLAENGANPAAIQLLLGHESLDTTTRYVNASDKYAEKTHRKYHPLKI